MPTKSVDRDLSYLRGKEIGQNGGFEAFKKNVESEIRGIAERYLDKIGEEDERERLLYYLKIENSSFRRPLNLILTGMALGAEKEELMLLASAIQLSQEFILMADDFIDDSQFRRGKDSYHFAYGNENTINDALMLLSVTWEMISDYVDYRRDFLGDNEANRIRKKFYEVGKLTYSGESMDINMLKRAGSLGKISYEDVIEMISLKTSAYTVWGPMQLGALAAGANERVLNAIKEIGEPAGIAFQILDDIKDFKDTKEQLGKEPFSDIWESKPTIVILRAYDSATEEEKEELNRIYMKSKKEKTEAEIKKVIGLIEKYKGVEYASEEAQKWIGKAAEKFVKYDSDKDFRKCVKSPTYLSWLLTSIALVP
ncbi:MAG: polyprenyl synthetase family protein [Candidatus Micrarchaeia archaeon]